MFQNDNFTFQFNPSSANMDVENSNRSNQLHKSEESDDSQPQKTRKTNFKNVYIRKIKHFIENSHGLTSSLVHNHEKFIRNIDSQDQEGEVSKYQKQRNKISAKQSRERKKYYIEILEEKVRAQEQEINNHKAIIEQNRVFLSELQQDPNVSQFFIGKIQYLQKIGTVNTNDELTSLLDSMRLRIGGGSKNRNKTSNHFFIKTLNTMIPTHMRYVLKSAKDEVDLFSLGNKYLNEWSERHYQKLNIQYEQKVQAQDLKNELQSMVEQLEHQIRIFKQVKDNIIDLTSKSEELIDKLRDVLTPQQIASFVQWENLLKQQPQLSITSLFPLLTNIDI